MELWTVQGRNLQVEARQVGPVGVVQYAVDTVGTFSLGWSTYWPDDEPMIYLYYGEHDGTHRPNQYGWRPGQPVIYGVEICGDAQFAPSRVFERPGDAEHCGWLACRRAPRGLVGGGSVPARTHQRAADIVRALAYDYLDREDSDDLLAAWRAYKAPERLEECRRRIAQLQKEIAEHEAKLAKWQQRAARQAALVPKLAGAE